MKFRNCWWLTEGAQLRPKTFQARRRLWNPLKKQSKNKNNKNDNNDDEDDNDEENYRINHNHSNNDNNDNDNHESNGNSREQVPGIFSLLPKISLSKWSQKQTMNLKHPREQQTDLSNLSGFDMSVLCDPGKKADYGGKDHPGRFRVVSMASVIRVVLPRMVVPHRFIFWWMNVSWVYIDIEKHCLRLIRMILNWMMHEPFETYRAT